jgi:hypothetical protein
MRVESQKIRSELGPLSRARQYLSAESYAAANNSISVRSTDPQHLKDRSEREHNNLKAQWDRWKNLGLIDAQESPY